MGQFYIWALLALVCAAVLSLALTPLVRVFAYKIGAIDIPKDSRRMHKKPMPLLGGLAIFLSVSLTGLLFCLLFGTITPRLIACWCGGFLIVLLGILDDKFALNPWVKLAGQILAACVVLPFGVKVEFINLFGHYIVFGKLAYPITVLWIVAMTNAINLIDGLDGLACGVSAICSASLLIVTLLHADDQVALITAILTGACIGFLPFNYNPAKIFMGDTGALYLGYTLSLASIVGVFKTTAVVSCLIPIIIFGYPLFDTAFAFFRRIVAGRSPFSADRGHLHHKIVDMGLSVKQSVTVLYCVTSMLGLLAVMLSEERTAASIVLLLIAVVIGALNYLFVKNKNTQSLTGLGKEEQPPEKAENETLPPEISAKDDGKTNESPDAEKHE